METMTKYKAVDGNVFDTEDECIAHEAMLKNRPAIEAFLAERVDPGPYRTGVTRYIQLWERDREQYLGKSDAELKAHAEKLDQQRQESRSAAKGAPKNDGETEAKAPAKPNGKTTAKGAAAAA